MNRLLLSLVLLSSAGSAFASAEPVQASPTPVATPTPKPKISCPCDHFAYKALTPKGQALADYWKSRRQAKLAARISGGFFLFALMARDGRAVRESDNAYRAAMDKHSPERNKAEAAGAVKVTGEEFEDGVQILAKEGVDFVIDVPKKK